MMIVPELPEVETVRRTLTGLVKGKRLNRRISDGRISSKTRRAGGIRAADCRRNDPIHRKKGKVFAFPFGSLCHGVPPAYGGKYGLHQADEPDDKHVHVVFHMTDGTQLRYRDVRKFGTMHLFAPGEERIALPLSQLGPEPDDEAFTADYLKERLAKTNRAVKTALLDQKAVVGLGNIYVDEALFRARIHPETKANSLSDGQIKTLHTEIKDTLQEAIDAGGSTVRSYINSQGKSECFSSNITYTAKRMNRAKRAAR